MEGKGSDPDNLGKNSTWIIDSNIYPFYQGEVYHQFHDDFMPDENGKFYDQVYNDLVILKY